MQQEEKKNPNCLGIECKEVIYLKSTEGSSLHFDIRSDKTLYCDVHVSVEAENVNHSKMSEESNFTMALQNVRSTSVSLSPSLSVLYIQCQNH